MTSPSRPAQPPGEQRRHPVAEAQRGRQRTLQGEHRLAGPRSPQPRRGRGRPPSRPRAPPPRRARVPVGGSDTPHSDRHTATVITRTDSPRPSVASEGRSAHASGRGPRGRPRARRGSRGRAAARRRRPGPRCRGPLQGGEILRARTFSRAVGGGPRAAEVEPGEPVHEGAAGGLVGTPGRGPRPARAQAGPVRRRSARSSTGAGGAMCACCRSTADPTSPYQGPLLRATHPARPRNRRGSLVFTFSARGRTNGRGRGPDGAGGGGGHRGLRRALRPAPPVGGPLRPSLRPGRREGGGADAGHLREAVPNAGRYRATASSRRSSSGWRRTTA